MELIKLNAGTNVDDITSADDIQEKPQPTLLKIGSVDDPVSANAGNTPDYKRPEIQKQLMESGDLDMAMRVSKGNLEYSLSRTMGIAPDKAAKVDKISKLLKLPKDTVDRNLLQSEGLLEARDVLELIGSQDDKGNYKYPYTLAWLSNPDKMAQAKDDVAAFAEIEHLISRNSQKEEGRLKQIARGFGAGSVQVAKTITQMPGFGQEIVGETIKNRVPALKDAKFLDAPDYMFSNAITKYLDDVIKDITPIKAEGSAIAMIREGNITEAVDNIIMNSAISAPNMAIMLGLTAATGGAAGLAFAGLTSATSSFADDRAAGRDDKMNALASVLKGSAEAGFEMVTLGNFKAIYGALGKQLTKEVGEEAATLTMKEVFKKTLSESFQEGASEGATTVAQDLADFFTGKKDAMDGNMERALNSVLVGGFTGGVMSGAGHVMVMNSQIAKARQNANDMDRVNEILKESPAFKRSPDLIEDFVKSVSGGDLYVPLNAVATYFQNDPKKVKAFAESLGVTNEQLVEAEANGTDLKIDKAKFMKNFMATEIFDGLKKNIKYNVDGMSLEEVEQLEAQMKQDVNDANDSFKELKVELQLPDKLKGIKANLVEQKGMNPKDADAQLAVLYAGAKTFAAKSGKNIDEYLNDVVVQLDAQAPQASDSVFNQADIETPEFKAFFEGSKVVDPEGKPLVVYHGTENTFDTFSYDFLRTNGTSEGVGFYFTDDANIAKGYEARDKGNTMPVYLDIKKPMTIDQKKITKAQWAKIFKEFLKKDPEVLSNYADARTIGEARAIAEAVRLEYEGSDTDLDIIGSIGNGGVASHEDINRAVKKVTGYDGVINKGYSGNTGEANFNVYVVFTPEQIKSIDNKGTFNKEDPNIYNQDPLGFYSKLSTEVEKMDFKAMPAKDLLNRVKKLGLKQDELDYTGVVEYLNSIEGKVTKEEVVQFLKEGGVKIEEVVKGGELAEPTLDDPEVRDDVVNQARANLQMEMNYPDFQELDNNSPLTEYLNKWYKDPNDRANKDAIDELIAPHTNMTMDDFIDAAIDDVGRNAKYKRQSTQYENYVEPGSENYREVLLTLPTQPLKGKFSVELVGPDEYQVSLDDRFFGNPVGAGSMKEALDIAKKRYTEEYQAKNSDNFRTNHFSELNVLAHFRLSDHPNSLINPKYVDPKSIKLNFDDAYELVDKGDYYKIKNRSEDEEYAASYPKDVLTKVGMTEGQLKDYFMGEPFTNAEGKVFTSSDELRRAHPEYKKAENVRKTIPSRVLFVEEIQSDWHQLGKKKGYKKDQDFRIELNKIQEERRAFKAKMAEKYNDPRPFYLMNTEERLEQSRIGGLEDALIKANEANLHGVPDAPFKQTEAWAMLAFKRILRMAVEQGYDEVQWTTGEQQAQRYDLSKQIDSIVYNKDEDGLYAVQAIKNKSEVFSRENVHEEDLPNLVGKEVAQKMVDQEGPEKDAGDGTMVRSLSGLDLKVGGEGMKGFYDNILPKAVDKYVKKLDKEAKVTKAGSDVTLTDGRTGSKVQMPSADQYWTLPITDAIKAEVLKGQSLFQKGKGPKGSIQFAQDGKSIISLYENSDFSTLLHETGHFFTNELKKAAETDAQSKADLDTLIAFAGGELNREGHEKIARGFEAYLREGKAPSVALQKAFRRIKTWLLNIYRSLAGLNVTINDEVRAVFDRMLASEAEIVEAETYYKEKQIAESFFKGTKLTDAQKTKLDELRKEAHEQAIEIQTAKAMNAYFKAIGKTPLDEADIASTTLVAQGKKPLKDQAKNDVNSMRVYKVINESTEMGGLNRQEFERYAGANTTSEVAKTFPKIFDKVDPVKTKSYRKFVIDEGGIDPNSLSESQRKQVKEAGAFGVYRTKGEKLDVLATSLMEDGKLIVPNDRNDADFLLDMILENKDYSREYVGNGVENTLDATAIHYEYESTEELVRELSTAVSKQEAYDTRYNELLANREAQLKNEFRNSEITYPGEESLYNEATMEYLVEQAKVLAGLRAKDKGITAKRYEAKAYKDAARQSVGFQKVKDAIRYDKYVAKERQFSKELYEAIKANDDQKAQDAKEKQLRNNALVLASIEARDILSKKIKAMNKIVKAPKGSIIGNYHDAIIELLNAHGVTDKKASRPDKVDMASIIKELEEGVDPIAVPDIARDLNNKTHYKDLTFEELESLAQAVNILAARGRNTIHLNKEGKAMTIEDKVDDCLSVMVGRKGVKTLKRSNPFYKAVEWGKGILAETMHVQFDLKRADGYTGIGLKREDMKIGPNEEMFDIIFRKQKGAAQNFNDFNKSYMEQIGKELSDIHQRLNTGTRGIDIQNVIFPPLLRDNGYTGWTSEMIVSLALNTGNKGNLDTLMKGYNMTLSEVKAVMGLLTEKELQTIQKIWDSINTLFPAMDETHLKQNGFRLKKVEPQEIVVQAYDESGTPRFVTLKGGYYPEKFDSELSRKVAGYTEKDIMKNESLAIHHRSKPRDSMTKERKGSKLPLKLSIQPLYAHVRDTINYTHMAEVLNDVHKVTKNDKFASSYSNLLGKERYDLITPWLSSIARPEVQMDGPVDYALSKLQRLTAIGALGASLLSFAKQTTALVSAMRDVSPTDIAFGCYKVLSNPVGAIKEVETRSIFMKDRNSKVQMEIAKQLEKIDPFTKKVTIFGKELSIKDLQDFALQNIRLGDILGAYPTWIGAYNKSIKKGLTEVEAVHFADKVISETQPTSSAMFNNLWQAGGPRSTAAGKMIRWTIAPFTGWTMKYGSRSRTYWNGWKEGKISTKDFAEHVMYERLLPPMLVPLMVTAIHGDDDAEKIESYIYEILSYQMSWIPGLNNVVGLIKYGSFRGVMELPTAKPVKQVADVITSANKTLQGEKDFVEFAKALGYVAEFWTGIPAMKAAKEVMKGSEAITKMTD